MGLLPRCITVRVLAIEGMNIVRLLPRCIITVRVLAIEGMNIVRLLPRCIITVRVLATAVSIEFGCLTALLVLYAVSLLRQV